MTSLSPETQAALDDGLARYAAGRYFDAHEVWEDAWREESGPVRVALQGLIQLAAAHHKALVMKNLSGAAKLFARARATLTSAGLDALGPVTFAPLLERMRAAEASVAAGTFCAADAVALVGE